MIVYTLLGNTFLIFVIFTGHGVCVCVYVTILVCY